MAIIDAGPLSTSTSTSTSPQDPVNVNGISHPAAHPPPATISPSGGPSPTSLNGTGVAGAATGVNGAATGANGGDLLQQLWGVITELSEQLTHNRAVSVGLFGLAGEIKTQAVNAQTGFVFRRYNLDKTPEEYETELVNMNAAMTLENKSLQHDNKQLNALIKEYEQMLEVVMSKFRNKALDTQSHELSLIRSYESHLLAREEENTAKDLALATSLTHSLVRLSGVLRGLVRLESGEEHLPQIMGGLTVAHSSTSPGEGASSTGLDAEVDSDAEVLEDREPWMGLEASESDYALERDIELARLEKENEELRRLAGLLPPLPPQHHATQSQNPFQNHATGHGHGHGLGERTMSGGLGGLVERRATGPEYRSIFDPVQTQSQQQQQQQHLAGGRLLLNQMGLGQHGQMHGQMGR